MVLREPRRSVIIPARVRTTDAWQASLIRNTSSRGLLLEIVSPPPRGSVLQIRRGAAILDGRVAWASGCRCGVQTSQTISEEYLFGRRGRESTHSRAMHPKVCRSTTGLLTDLKLAHDELLTALIALEDAMAAPAPPNHYPLARYRLSRASRARSVLVATICSELLTRATPMEASQVTALQVDGVSRLLESASHVQTWTLDRVSEHWEAYREAAAKIRESMRERIETEKATLYALMG